MRCLSCDDTAYQLYLDLQNLLTIREGTGKSSSNFRYQRIRTHRTLFLDRLVHLQAPYVPRTQTISRYDLFMLTAEGLQASCLFQPWMHPGQKEGSYDEAHL